MDFYGSKVEARLADTQQDIGEESVAALAPHVRDRRIAVVGLGYVGLPLAVALDEAGFDVHGIDVNARRIDGLLAGDDATGEIESDRLATSDIAFSASIADAASATAFIVTVPTPVDAERRPDLGLVELACRSIATVLKRGDLVVFESTVYPGVTEDLCGRVLAEASGLECGTDFVLGYSPERINPGDKTHTISKIVKVVSGQDAETLERVCDIYGEVIEAGLHRATSIKVAEAAKVIENTQRDVNIALMNELSLIFDRVGVRTKDVLAAAGSKWNFLPFHPGLVGGHCIGVDPYYLTSLAERLNYHPQVILAGRRINDGMGAHVAQQAIKALVHSGRSITAARIGVLGLTFKEDVPDFRNSKVFDIVSELAAFGADVQLYDPYSEPGATYRDGRLVALDAMQEMDVLVMAVAHREFRAMGEKAISERLSENGIVVDVRSMLDPAALRDDITYWSL